MEPYVDPLLQSQKPARKEQHFSSEEVSKAVADYAALTREFSSNAEVKQNSAELRHAFAVMEHRRVIAEDASERHYLLSQLTLQGKAVIMERVRGAFNKLGLKTKLGCEVP